MSLETTSSDSFLLCDGSMTILSGDLGELGSKVGVGFELDRSSEGGGGDGSKRRQSRKVNERKSRKNEP